MSQRRLHVDARVTPPPIGIWPPSDPHVEQKRRVAPSRAGERFVERLLEALVRLDPLGVAAEAAAAGREVDDLLTARERVREPASH